MVLALTVEEESMLVNTVLGIGTSVKHQISIKDNCIIGGQSRNKKLYKNSLYFGIP